MTELVKPATCRKCGGSGIYHYVSGALGDCSRCSGTGQVESDKATIAAQKAQDAENIRVGGLILGLARSDHKVTYMSHMALDGMDFLRIREPERYAKAVASVERRHPGVVKALAEYYTEHREEFYGRA